MRQMASADFVQIERVPDEGGHQRSSEAIRGHHGQLEVITQRPRGEVIIGDQWAGNHGSSEAITDHSEATGEAISGRAIMGHQRLLALVSFAVLMREAISVHQRSSEVIRGHQRLLALVSFAVAFVIVATSAGMPFGSEPTCGNKRR